MKANSETMKYAIMSYYRFKRGFVCASECLNADVLVYTNKKEWHEIEIKNSKSDMWKGEARKFKHWKMKNDPDKQINKYGWMPHKFYMAVPENLVDEAKKWVEATNSKYGIIMCKFNDRNYVHAMYSTDITIIKSASHIHKRECKGGIITAVMKRVCSENINHMEHFIRENEARQEDLDKRSEILKLKWSTNNDNKANVSRNS